MEIPSRESRNSDDDDESIELAVGNLKTRFSLRLPISTTNSSTNELANSGTISSSNSSSSGTIASAGGTTKMDILETQEFLPNHLSFRFGQQDSDKSAPFNQIQWIHQPETKGRSCEENAPKWGGKTWQIIANICASFFCIPFGIAFGWPSPTYPVLLQANASIPITLDQSAMIAGFLMIGNTVGSPLTGPGRVSSKHALIAGTALMTIGWLIMWQAANLYCLLGSRFLVGLGHAFGLGYLRQYIREMADAPLATHLNKALTLWMSLGIILAVTYGNYVDFESFGLLTVILTVVILFIDLCLPTTPSDLIQKNRMQDAANLIRFLKPTVNTESELADIYRKITSGKEQPSNLKFLFTNTELRIRFATFSLLVFFQQFTGFPATIIYSKIILMETGYTEDCAIYLSIAYCVIYFLANFIAIYFVIDFKLISKKYLILTSTVFVLCANALLTYITYFMDAKIKLYAFYPVFCAFLVAHTLGLGNTPVTLINDYFPAQYQHFGAKYFVMVHSMCGLVITKLFQVVLGIYGLYASFLMFSCISAICVLFIVIFVPKFVKVVNF